MLFITLSLDVRHERTQVGLGSSLVRDSLTEGDVWSRTGAAHADALDMLLSGQERLIEVRLRSVYPTARPCSAYEVQQLIWT
jgi:hypothetical protein